MEDITGTQEEEAVEVTTIIGTETLHTETLVAARAATGEDKEEEAGTTKEEVGEIRVDGKDISPARAEDLEQVHGPRGTGINMEVIMEEEEEEDNGRADITLSNTNNSNMLRAMPVNTEDSIPTGITTDSMDGMLTKVAEARVMDQARHSLTNMRSNNKQRGPNTLKVDTADTDRMPLLKEAVLGQQLALSQGQQPLNRPSPQPNES